MSVRTLYITRQVEFSAAHRLYREDLSESENYALFGKCANPYGHGHNYLLEVTLKGEQKATDAMLLHFSSLKRILEEVIVTPLDHRHLNHDVPFLKGILPTSENIVTTLWDRIEPAVRLPNCSLYKLKLSSSARNWVEYYGPDH